MKQISRPQHKLYSPAKRIGKLLAKTFEEDPNFYFFSPDETTSNKFDQIFVVENEHGGIYLKNHGIYQKLRMDAL